MIEIQKTKSTTNSDSALSGVPRTFRYQQNIGKARHVVSYHDGQKTHRDGSAFFDMAVFSRKTEAQRYVRTLREAGYVEE